MTPGRTRRRTDRSRSRTIRARPPRPPVRRAAARRASARHRRAALRRCDLGRRTPRFHRASSYQAPAHACVRLKNMSTSATPAMRQYLDAKQLYRDAILLFRMGDFYEMFYEDALVAARALELTLTSRSKDGQGASIPMCGVPHHAVDSYLARLVKKGFRVAICDQVEDPRKAKGLVKREIVRVVSPGTLTDAQYLDAREPAFLLSITPGARSPKPEASERTESVWGVALLDLSTGEFSCAEYAGKDGLQALADEIS